MSQNAKTTGEGDMLTEFDIEDPTDDGSSSSLWLVLALAFLALLLTWIVLGVWRYLQVLGNGTF